MVGHHEDSFPVEKLDVNTTGELVASISHDNRWGTVGNGLECRKISCKNETWSKSSALKYAVVISWCAPCTPGYKRAAIAMPSLSPPLFQYIGGVEEFRQ